jgi:hypothetical protein
MITHATGMPCADFYASVEDGVARAMQNVTEKRKNIMSASLLERCDCDAKVQRARARVIEILRRERKQVGTEDPELNGMLLLTIKYLEGR